MFWEIITIFGDVQFWVGAALVSLIFLFTVPKRAKKHVVWFVFMVLPAVTISYSITYVLKGFFKILRPCFGLPLCPTMYSFPSGHATVIFAAASGLIFYYEDKRLSLLLLVSALLVALSRLMLGVHKLEDIIAGSIIGIVVGILVQRAYKTYHREIGNIVKNIE